jgi:hypothetical protein
MTTFSTDGAGRLVCDVCGETLFPVDEPASGLTSQQAAARWPDQAEEVKFHAVVCTFRQNPEAPVYFHAMGRDENADGYNPDEG